MYGDEGADELYGGTGDDRLDGGDGDDKLYGGQGADQLYGGEGQDTFVFNSIDDSLITSPDTILDFKSGVDKIDLSALNITSCTFADCDTVFVGHLFSIDNVTTSTVYDDHRKVSLTYDESKGITYLQAVLPWDHDFQVIIAGQPPSFTEDFII